MHELPREKYPQKTNVGTQWEASDVKHEIQVSVTSRKRSRDARSSLLNFDALSTTTAVSSSTYLAYKLISV